MGDNNNGKTFANTGALVTGFNLRGGEREREREREEGEGKRDTGTNTLTLLSLPEVNLAPSRRGYILQVQQERSDLCLACEKKKKMRLS